MGLWLLKSLLLSFVLTLVLEEGFALLFGIRDRRDLLLVGFVNVITNPVVVLSYYLALHYTKFNRGIVIIFLELAAIFIEAYYFKNYGKKFRRPLLFAFGVNIFSYGIGQIINLVFC